MQAQTTKQETGETGGIVRDSAGQLNVTESFSRSERCGARHSGVSPRTFMDECGATTCGLTDWESRLRADMQGELSSPPAESY